MRGAFVKTIFADGVYTLGGRILRSALALCLSVLLARGLGPHDRGLYALPTAVYTGIVLAVFTGIFPAVSYFMLNERAGRGVLRPALVTGGIFTAAGALPVSVMAIASKNGWALLPSLIVLAANVPPTIVMGYAVGTKQIRWQTAYAASASAATLLAVSCAFLFFPRNAGTAVSAFVAVSVLIAAACSAVTARDARRLETAPVAFGAFFFFAVRAGLANLVTQLNYRGDLYVVALLTTPALLGEYTVAISAAEALLLITQIPAVVLSPHVGSMERAESAQTTARCVRVTAAAALAIAALFYAILPLAIHVLYGNAYAGVVPVLRVLLAGVVLLSIATPLTNFFTFKLGRPEISLVSSGAAAAACILVSLLLVPKIGITGAAIATAGAYLLGQSITVAFFTKATGIALRAVLVPTAADARTLLRLGAALTAGARSRVAARQQH